MDLFNQLGEKLGSTLQTVRDSDATKKAKNYASLPGLTLQVGKLESKIKTSYQEIGEAYYLTHAMDPDMAYEKQFAAIREAKAQIAELRLEIDRIKKYDPAKERAEVFVDRSQTKEDSDE